MLAEIIVRCARVNANKKIINPIYHIAKNVEEFILNDAAGFLTLCIQQ